MTNLNRNFLLLLAIIAIAAVSACNDPTGIGSELIEGDFSDIRYTDTITVVTSTATQDSVQTYTPNVASQSRTYLCGKLNDPLFGKSEAAIYFDLRLLTTSSILGRDTVFQGGILDSMVLALAYDTTRIYGDTLLPQTINVFRVTDDMDSGDDHFSDENFSTEFTPVGSVNDLYARPRMESVVIEGPDTVTYAPQLRIPMDGALANELMNYDSLVYSSSEDFQEVFKGLKIVADNETNILSFNLASASTHMRLYYTVDDTLHHAFTYDITDLSLKHNFFSHNYSGSESEPFIGNSAMGDSLIFVQGMSGYNVKIDFPYIQSLKDEIAVNKAELEFTYAYIPGDDTTNFYSPLQLALTYQDADGKYFFIDDLNEAAVIGDLTEFGGQILEEDADGVFVKRYRMNVSNYLQDIIDDNLGAEGNSIYLQVYLKNQHASRAVLYGPGHSQYPLKLNLTYTKL